MGWGAGGVAGRRDSDERSRGSANAGGVGRGGFTGDKTEVGRGKGRGGSLVLAVRGSFIWSVDSKRGEE